VQLFHVNIRNNKTGGRKITTEGKRNSETEKERKSKTPFPFFLFGFIQKQTKALSESHNFFSFFSFS
jgi:hypothetical protein